MADALDCSRRSRQAAQTRAPFVFLTDSIRRLGLLHIEPGHSVDAYLRIPLAPQSVFRGSVLRGGIPVSDILQVWLDVLEHPARGHAQALEIQRGALRSVFGEK